MIGIDIIQKAIIAEIKSKPAITSLVTNTDSVVEVREVYWNGTDFEFPAIRVAIHPALPSIEGCEYTEFGFSVYVISESTSSKEATDIQTTVISNITNSFSYSDGGTDYRIYGVRIQNSGLIPPSRINLRLWENEVRYNGQISLQ